AAAYAAINLVRKRAFGKLLPGAVDPDQYDLSGLNKDSFFREIVDERKRELAFEANRKTDLLRWELYLSVMHQTGTQFEIDMPGTVFSARYKNVTNRDLLWPIPAREVVAN